MNKPILHLNVSRKWFNMLLSGEKKEEYRDLKPFYCRIFVNGKIKIKGKYYHPTDVIICFSNGYAKNRDQLFVQCAGLRVGCGCEKWGAWPWAQYFVLKVGRFIEAKIQL